MPTTPPPVGQSAVAEPNEDRALTVREANYSEIRRAFTDNNAVEMKAIRAMFANDKRLADRFMSVVFSLLAQNNDLLEKARPATVIEAIRQSARLGLEPLTEEAGIVVYNGEAQLLPMYRGYLKRIRNSGLVRAVDAAVVYQNDEFEYGYNEKGGWFKHVPAKPRKVADPETGELVTENSRGDYWQFYAYAIGLDGFTWLRVMDVDQINYVRDTYGRTHTKGGKPLPWVTAYDQMGLKTVIRNLSKMLPQEAVGRELMEIEQAHDERALAEISKKVDDGMSEVRALALRAVGASPEPSSDPPSGTDPEKATTASTPEKEEAPAGPEKVERDTGEPGPMPNIERDTGQPEGLALLNNHTHSTDPGWTPVRGCPACEQMIRPPRR